MLESNTFYFIPHWLGLEGHRLPVIVTGKKTACWHSGEISHLSAVCLRKKAPQKTPNHMRNTHLPASAKTKMEAPVVLPAIRASSPGTAEEKEVYPLFLIQLARSPPTSQKKIVGKGGRKIQPVAFQFWKDNPHLLIPKQHIPQERPQQQQQQQRSDALAWVGKSSKNF